ncbi:class I SAM-dependent methyltransferase [bacterium]|nr:class I SAM-dependent methyltransferase [candidate division CSSED10-310 bacterium]
MLYDTISIYYDQIFPLNRQIVHFLLRYIRIHDDVLDIGCGTATLTKAVSDRCRRITGIDPSAAMIREGMRKYPDMNLLETGIFEFKNDRFDIIFSTGNTVSYFDPVELQLLARKILTLLLPGGYWIYQTVNWDYLNDKESYEFPDIRIADGVFRRRYDFSGPELTEFKLEILHSGIPPVSESHWLHRLTRDTHIGIHLDAGFQLLDSYASWSCEPWTPEKPGATILVFIKPGTK